MDSWTFIRWQLQLESGLVNGFFPLWSEVSSAEEGSVKLLSKWQEAERVDGMGCAQSLDT